MPKAHLEGKKHNLYSIKRGDFLYEGQIDPGDWDNRVGDFKSWNIATLFAFIVLSLLTGVGVVHFYSHKLGDSLFMVWIFILWVLASGSFSFIKNYLDEGIFEQGVRYAFQQARDSVRTEEWALWLGRAYEIILSSPVMIRKMNPWQVWVRGANNPAHFDWILDRLRDLGIFLHEDFTKGQQRGANPALDRRYDDALDRIIAKLDGVKSRWMWILETIVHLSMILMVLSLGFALLSLNEVLGGRKGW